MLGSPDPEDVLEAGDEPTLPAHTTLKEADQGKEEDLVVTELRLLTCQSVNDLLVEPWHKNIDSSQGEDKQDADNNSDLKTLFLFWPEIWKDGTYLVVQTTPC